MRRLLVENADDDEDDSKDSSLSTPARVKVAMAEVAGKILTPPQINQLLPDVPIKRLWNVLNRLAADPTSGIKSVERGLYCYETANGAARRTDA